MSSSREFQPPIRTGSEQGFEAPESIAAQLRYRIVLLCGHGNEPPFTVSSYPPTTASLAKCETCDRYVPVSVEVSRG